MLDNYEVQREMLDNYRYANDYWAPYVQDTKIYTLAQSGYTWTPAERKALIKDNRDPVEFNIMRRPQQFYSGYLRDNIKNVVITGKEGNDEQTADQLDKVSANIWNGDNGFPVFLDAYDEAFKSGMCLIGVQMDYSKDFINGDISFYKRTYNSFYLDPTFENIDLSDCGFAIMRDLINRQSLKSLLPDVDPAFIDEIQSSRDNKFLNFHPQSNVISKNKNLLAYDQYYRRKTRPRKMLIDQRTGFARDITEMPKEELDQLKMGLGRLKRLESEYSDYDIPEREIPKVEIKTVERPYIELNVLLNGESVYCGEDKTKITEVFPFAPCLCYFEPSIMNSTQRVQGIAATQWSMQRQFNKRHVKIIDMMDSDIATGYLYALGTVPNPSELQQTGQNKLVGVSLEDNPLGLDAVRPLSGGNASPATFEYQKILDELSLTLANVTESLLGTDEGGNTQVSGRLAQVRVAQGLRSSRKIFDNVEKTQAVLGRLVLMAIQNNYPPEKIERILGDGQVPTEQFYNKEFEEYDATIKQGIRSQSQKDAYYAELVNLKREGIVDVPQTAIVDALQMSGISDLKESIEEQQEQEKAQQEKINAQEEMALRLANSQAEANLAMSGERRARIQSDLALATERISESEENRAQAALAKAKTITEIASMNEDRIMKVLGFVEMLEQQEIQDREAIGQKVESQSQEIETSQISEPPQAPQEESGLDLNNLQ